jgi:MFS family permease
MTDQESAETTVHRPPPTWIFGISNIPFGVSGTFAGVAMPFLLSEAGLTVKQIALIGGLALVPAYLQFIWAPVLDMGLRRRTWLVLVSFFGSLCLAVAMVVKLPEHLVLYGTLIVAGQLLCGLVASCNGALVSTVLPEELRPRAAGWINAANLGATSLGGGLVLTLARQYSMQAAAIGLGLSTFLPSLAAFAIQEPPPAKAELIEHLRDTCRDVWKAVKARQGWTGLLFCISPVGTVALTNLLSGMGKDYHADARTIELLNGWAGGFITAAGALITGYLLHRFNRRAAYLLSGVLTALCAAIMALCPMTLKTYVVGTAFYLLIAGFAYTAFSAVVYEIVGTAGKTAATLYSVFPAAGNAAIFYVLIVDGVSTDRWGTRGVLWTDALLNVAGVIFLLLMLRVVFRQGPPPDLDVDPLHQLEEPAGRKAVL